MNQRGGAAKMPAPSSLDVASAVADQWAKDMSGQQGFRQGSSIAPGRAQNALEVSSFLQVPAILKALENGESLRLKFPEPAPGTPDADMIREEQKQIRAFIKGKASMSFADIQTALTAKIDSCLEFSKASGGKFSAQDWISAHGLDTTAKSLTLNVTSIYRGDAAVAGGQVELDSLIAKLDGHLADKKGTKAILTVEVGNTEALAKAILDSLETRGSEPKGLANVTVWVGASNDPFTGASISGEDCNALEVISLDQFLKRYGKGKAAAPQPTPGPQAQPSQPTTPPVSVASPWPKLSEQYVPKYYAV
jgi:hypothetical protein